MNSLNKNINDLMNYEQQSSNSNNYGSFKSSPSPESFPVLMKDGIIVRYDTFNFSSNIILEDSIQEEE